MSRVIYPAVLVPRTRVSLVTGARAPTVGLVVLNWNGWVETQDCLVSLRQVTYAPVRIYVVDNGSTDGSPAQIATEYPEMALVALETNRGFGGGMNAGIQAALADGCDHILCLNNDMVVEPDFLEPLVAAATDRVVPYPAQFQKGEPEVIDNLGQHIDLRTGLTRMIATGSRAIPEEVNPDYSEVPLLPRALLEEIGGWDASYFALYEDADLGLRLLRAGWRLVLVPGSRIYHLRGATAERVPGLLSYYSMRNRLRVVRSHGTRGNYVTTVLHVLLVTLPYVLLRKGLSRRDKHAVRYVLLGIADGLLPGRWEVTRRWELRTGSTAAKP